MRYTPPAIILSLFQSLIGFCINTWGSAALHPRLFVALAFGASEEAKNCPKVYIILAPFGTDYFYLVSGAAA